MRPSFESGITPGHAEDLELVLSRRDETVTGMRVVEQLGMTIGIGTGIETATVMTIVGKITITIATEMMIGVTGREVTHRMETAISADESIVYRLDDRAARQGRCIDILESRSMTYPKKLEFGTWSMICSHVLLSVC